MVHELMNEAPSGAIRVGKAPGVLGEIVTRRAADLTLELGDRSYRDLLNATEAARVASPARESAESFAAPGLHVIAEIKRRSPSAGALAPEREDLVARARAYQAGGAAAISVLCEPHWFGGSIDDLRAVRAAVSIPVLAKEFVVDERQLPLLRAAGADMVLLLAVVHSAARLASLVGRARALGLEPLVEVHDEREIAKAVASGARLIGINSRNLKTMQIDVERVARLRALIPADRIVIGESGVREPSILRGWRALGIDGALIGEGLMRSADPAAAVRAFVHAGSLPDDCAARDRAALVKACGITDSEGALAAVRAGVDAIGLNFVPGTPRALDLAEAATLARLVRRASPAGGPRPRIVAVTADARPAELASIVERVDPDVIQLCGSERPDTLAALPRPAWKVLRLPPAGATADATGHEDAEIRDELARSIIETGRAFLATGRCERILLDASGGRHPGGTGLRVDPVLAATVARELPVVLAGGLSPANVGEALLTIPATGVDAASGIEETGRAGRRPRKDPLLVALYAKRARAARWDLPVVASRPAPVDPGLLDADAAGRWGINRDFGGRYVPETLIGAFQDLERAWNEVRLDPRYWAELRELLVRFTGRPSALYRADRYAADVLAEARALAAEVAPGHQLPQRLRVHLKREDLNHTGAHKVTNALGQALLTRRLGKTRVIAETGAGQHGVATATVCALLDIPCVVYMGAEDIERQQPNVQRMRALGAEVRSVTSGSATLKDAVSEAMRDWVTNVETTHYVLGSAMGAHPYPTIVRDLQRIIGDEAAAQIQEVEGRMPDLALACVGGGSNAIGLLTRFIGEPNVRLAVAEAAGEGIPTGRHAAALAGGTPGILHGSRSLMLQDGDGQVIEAVSISAGLDYPGVGPQLSALFQAGRLELAAATDDEAVAAVHAMTRAEGILPALETAHAFAVLPRIIAGLEGSGRPLPEDAVVLIGLSGRGDKDLAAIERRERAKAEAAESAEAAAAAQEATR